MSEWLGDLGLTDDFGELGGSVFAIEGADDGCRSRSGLCAGRSRLGLGRLSGWRLRLSHLEGGLNGGPGGLVVVRRDDGGDLAALTEVEIGDGGVENFVFATVDLNGPWTSM